MKAKYFGIFLLFILSKLTLSANLGVSGGTFIDDKRNRPIKYEIWYPTLEAPKETIGYASLWKLPDFARDADIELENKAPLVILSHGHQGDRFGHAWLVKILVDSGFLVMTLDHYGNSKFSYLRNYSLELWERPQDISYALDKILESTKWSSLVDENRIGFIGYSFGGTTGLWLTGAKALSWTRESFMNEWQEGFNYENIDDEIISATDFSKAQHDYQDQRIKAFFLMAPAFAQGFPKSELEKLRTHVALVTTMSDSLVLPEKNANVLAKHIPDAELLVPSDEGSHYVFLNIPRKDAEDFIPAYLHRDPTGFSREEFHEEVGDMAVDFFNHYLFKEEFNG